MEPVAAIRKIPLDRLTLSPANVRKTPAPPSADAELQASIAAHGLKQNLIVHAADAKGDFAVVVGGRRLKALQALQAEGLLPADYRVPCQVEALDTAAETSLVENAVRLAMHPADEFEAMAALVDAGEEIAAIATRFGTTEHHVRQRLKLARVAPDLLDAYRAEEMDLEVLMAFAVTDDRDAQLSVWNTVKASRHRPAHWVRRLLTENSISSTSGIGRFVGIEAYEAAGGSVRRDLFSRDREAFMDDVQLVRRLADEKLQAAAQEISGDWKWVEPMPQCDYSHTSKFGRVYPEAAEMSPEVEQEFQEITAREGELEDLDDWTDEQHAEMEALTERREALEAELDDRANYTAEDRQRAGCIVTIGYNGELELRQGLVKPEDAAPSREPGADPATETDKANTFSQVLIEDLAAHRLQITKAHLVADPEAAFDLALYSLCIDILETGYRAGPLDLRAVRSREVSSRGDLDDTPAARVLEVQQAGLQIGWIMLPAAEGFQALCNLTHEAKRALFAWCVAQTLRPQLGTERGANPVIELIGERLGIDFVAFWRPTADNYWGRITKPQALAIAGDVLGERWTRTHAGDKKGVLAKVLEAAFVDDGTTALGVDPDSRARAATWMPPGMAYDPALPGGTADEDADADDEVTS